VVARLKCQRENECNELRRLVRSLIGHAHLPMPLSCRRQRPALAGAAATAPPAGSELLTPAEAQRLLAVPQPLTGSTEPPLLGDPGAGATPQPLPGTLRIGSDRGVGGDGSSSGSGSGSGSGGVSSGKHGTTGSGRSDSCTFVPIRLRQPSCHCARCRGTSCGFAKGRIPEGGDGSGCAGAGCVDDEVEGAAEVGRDDSGGGDGAQGSDEEESRLVVTQTLQCLTALAIQNSRSPLAYEYQAGPGHQSGWTLLTRNSYWIGIWQSTTCSDTFQVSQKRQHELS